MYHYPGKCSLLYMIWHTRVTNIYYEERNMLRTFEKHIHIGLRPYSAILLCNEANIRIIIMSSPVKSCSLDPMPTFLLHEHGDLLRRKWQQSLMHHWVKDSQKHAIVLPLLTKSGLNSADMANFCPVSNLSFLSKVIERVVTWQLNGWRMVCCRAGILVFFVTVWSV